MVELSDTWMIGSGFDLVNTIADKTEPSERPNETAKGELEPNLEFDNGTAVIVAIPDPCYHKHNVHCNKSAECCTMTVSSFRVEVRDSDSLVFLSTSLLPSISLSNSYLNEQELLIPGQWLQD